MSLQSLPAVVRPVFLPSASVAKLATPMFPPVSRDLLGNGVRHPLGLNESQSGPPERVLEAMIAASRHANFYPDPTAGELRAALSARLGLSAECVVVGAGSEELILTLARITGEVGKSIAYCEPCFPSYHGAVAVTAAEPRKVLIRTDGAEDVEGLLRAIDSTTSMVVAATPSNPGGVMLSAEDIEALAGRVPDDVLLVLDEAYYEYGTEAGGPDALAILDQKRPDGHWAVLRTFSKAYGLAGVRVGYALTSSTAVAQALLKASPVFNVSRVAQAAALAYLDVDDAMRDAVGRTAKQRERLKAWCAAGGLSCYDSVTNFVSIVLPVQGAVAASMLAVHGIASNPWRHPNFTNVLRVGIGGADATDATIEGLAACTAPCARAG